MGVLDETYENENNNSIEKGVAGKILIIILMVIQLIIMFLMIILGLYFTMALMPSIIGLMLALTLILVITMGFNIFILFKIIEDRQLGYNMLLISSGIALIGSYRNIISAILNVSIFLLILFTIKAKFGDVKMNFRGKENRPLVIYCVWLAVQYALIIFIVLGSVMKMTSSFY